ncbi:MAG: RagB/SusD family nutrient uptake outer membrane protein, partial [Bacteroidetes bacterium]|nr:RagB/SusD family nutrient uptake outer membrane protein [Bacteroidota bacterium]
MIYLQKSNRKNNPATRLAVLAGACLVMGLTGCKKYLETAPDNRTNLDTPEKVAQLLGTAYPQGNYMAFAEAISDNMNDKGIGGLDLTVLDPYMFKDVADNQQDSPEFYWNACYSAIAAANQALQSSRSASDTTKYKSEIGEALVARAYAHFMLVNFFSKTYDAATAASDPGIPYVT